MTDPVLVMRDVSRLGTLKGVDNGRHVIASILDFLHVGQIGQVDKLCLEFGRQDHGAKLFRLGKLQKLRRRDESNKTRRSYDLCKHVRRQDANNRFVLEQGLD